MKNWQLFFVMAFLASWLGMGLHIAEFGAEKHHHEGHECQFDDFLKQPLATADIFDFALPDPRFFGTSPLIPAVNQQKPLALAFSSRAPPTII